MKEVTVSSPLLSLSDKVVSHCAQPPGFQPQLVTLKFVSSPSLPPETRPQGRMSSWMARRAHCPCEVTLSAVWQSMRSPQQACPPSQHHCLPKATSLLRAAPHQPSEALPCPPPKQGWSRPLLCSSSSALSSRSHLISPCGLLHTPIEWDFWKAAPVLLTSLQWPPLPWGWSHNCLPSLVGSVTFWPRQPLCSHPVFPPIAAAKSPSLGTGGPVWWKLGCALPPPWLFTHSLLAPFLPLSGSFRICKMDSIIVLTSRSGGGGGV